MSQSPPRRVKEIARGIGRWKIDPDTDSDPDADKP
jgi:hypothetical protein